MDLRAVLRRQSGPVGLVLVIVATWTVFGLGGTGFLTSFNLYTVGQLAARDAVLGMAQALLVVVGRMNLAVGSIGAVCTSMLGYLLVVAHWPLPLALVVVAVVGIAAALLMGLAELRTGLSSFIVTLAFLSIYGGGALFMTHARNYQITSSLLGRLGSGTVIFSAVCPLVVVALACALIVGVLYSRTSLGWKMLAVGANERAAKASGVNVDRVVLASYAVSGVFCAVAAVMESSYELNVNASFGENWLLPSFIAVVLGGISLSGGEMFTFGILLAALFYDSLQSGLTILNVPSYWVDLAQGSVLLAAVLLDRARHARKGRKRVRGPAEVVAPEEREVVAA